MTIRQAIEFLAPYCSKQGAFWALSNLLDIDNTQLIMSQENELVFEDELSLMEIKRRLLNNEPLQYILGTWQFIDIIIKTDLRALIPRLETEYLAQNVFENAKTYVTPIILDIGCGSGCIGLYLKSKLPNAQVELIDISKKALDLTKENMQQLGVSCKITQADIFDIQKIACDIIVSNPPYIKSEEINSLDLSVKNFEPYTALDGGIDGLLYYRTLADFAANSLNEMGFIAMEIGVNQSDDVAQIFYKHFDDIVIIKDFNNIDRIVIAKR